jgi:hypothetical protein
MILFNLRCISDHDFDVWFKDGAAYENRAAGDVSCPVCGSAEVTKAPMAPRIARGLRDAGAPGTPLAEAAGQLRELCRKIAERCDYVGDRFAEEARRIHYGESKPRDIYGEASQAEVVDLREEGVAFQRVPWLPPTNS